MFRAMPTFLKVLPLGLMETVECRRLSHKILFPGRLQQMPSQPFFWAQIVTERHICSMMGGQMKEGCPIKNTAKDFVDALQESRLTKQLKQHIQCRPLIGQAVRADRRREILPILLYPCCLMAPLSCVRALRLVAECVTSPIGSLGYCAGPFSLLGLHHHKGRRASTENVNRIQNWKGKWAGVIA